MSSSSDASLGRQMTGGAGPNARQKDDFYPTPPEATRALLRAERCHLWSYPAVWEPCGRGGAIKRELTRACHVVVSTDIVADPDHDVSEQNLLTCERRLADAVVTNPPFSLAAKMIEHLDALGVDYIAMLLKATFFHAERRRALFEQLPPARIHALTWRPDYLGLGAPTMDCSWFVWQRGHTVTTYAPLSKT